MVSIRPDLYQWQDSLEFILVALLFISPWAFGYVDGTAMTWEALRSPVSPPAMATWHAWIVGALGAATIAAALIRFEEWKEWITLCIGLWIAMAPWMLEFHEVRAATTAHLAVGLLIALLALWEIRDGRRGLPRSKQV